jgi:hypothetical protein
MRGSAGPTSLNSGGPSAQTASRSQASSGRTSGSSGMSGAGRHGVETWVVLEYCNGGTLYDAAVRDDSALFVRDIMQVVSGGAGCGWVEGKGGRWRVGGRDCG